MTNDEISKLPPKQVESLTNEITKYTLESFCPVINRYCDKDCICLEKHIGINADPMVYCTNISLVGD